MIGGKPHRGHGVAIYPIKFRSKRVWLAWTSIGKVLHWHLISWIQTRMKSGSGVSALSVTVSVLRFRTTFTQPTQFPQSPSFFLGLHLVSGHLLFLLDNRVHNAVLRATTRWSSSSRCYWCVQPRSNRSICTTSFWGLRIQEGILDDCCFSLMGNSAIVDIPDFWAWNAWIFSLINNKQSRRKLTQRGHKFVVVRYNNLSEGLDYVTRIAGYTYHSSWPFFDGYGQSTKSLSVEEITRFIEYTYLKKNQEMKYCNTSASLPVGYSRGTPQLRAWFFVLYNEPFEYIYEAHNDYVYRQIDLKFHCIVRCLHRGRCPLDVFAPGVLKCHGSQLLRETIPNRRIVGLVWWNPCWWGHHDQPRYCICDRVPAI